jgi:hypothetical protein
MNIDAVFLGLAGNPQNLELTIQEINKYNYECVVCNGCASRMLGNLREKNTVRIGIWNASVFLLNFIFWKKSLIAAVKFH